MPQPTVDDDADVEQPPPNVGVPPQMRGPVFNTFPQQQQPQFVNPQQVGPNGAPLGPNGVQQVPNQPGTFPSSAPSAPFGGVAVPGMVAPVPQQQQQPGQPQPIPPPRRPGGQ
jgi:hypothetical protein